MAIAKGSMVIGVASVKLIYVVVVSYTVKIVPLCQMIGARPSATIYMEYVIARGGGTL